MAKNNKKRFFYVLYSDKTRVFDQSERVYYPIYIINRYRPIIYRLIIDQLQAGLIAQLLYMATRHNSKMQFNLWLQKCKVGWRIRVAATLQILVSCKSIHAIL